MKRSIPLGQENSWYVIERIGRWISPVSLEPLRPGAPEDLSDLDRAISAIEDDPQRFGSVGLRVTWPTVLIVLTGCVDHEGAVNSVIHDFTRSLGGYWEHSPVSGDIWGIAWTQSPVRSGEGWFRGHRAIVTATAWCRLTARPVPGCNGDPQLTDQVLLDSLLSAIG